MLIDNTNDNNIKFISNRYSDGEMLITLGKFYFQHLYD